MSFDFNRLENTLSQGRAEFVGSKIFNFWGFFNSCHLICFNRTLNLFFFFIYDSKFVFVLLFYLCLLSRSCRSRSSTFKNQFFYIMQIKSFVYGFFVLMEFFFIVLHRNLNIFCRDYEMQRFVHSNLDHSAGNHQIYWNYKNRVYMFKVQILSRYIFPSQILFNFILESSQLSSVWKRKMFDEISNS